MGVSTTLESDAWAIIAALSGGQAAMPTYGQLAAQVVALTRENEQQERHLGRVIDERDRYEALLDRFAYAVAPESQIGEHSSANDPWARALAILEGSRV